MLPKEIQIIKAILDDGIEANRKFPELYDHIRQTTDISRYKRSYDLEVIRTLVEAIYASRLGPYKKTLCNYENDCRNMSEIEWMESLYAVTV